MPVAIGAILAAIALAFGHLGYLGGPVYRDFPVAAGAHPRLAAVLMSGDMGLRVGMGPEIAQRLAADGIPTVGVNSLTFFRRTRTPDEVAALVQDAAARALARSHADRLLLVGQSFGADMLQVGLARLPPPLRARVRMVALIVPGATVEYRASPSEIFSGGVSEQDAMPTACLLDWAPVACIYGVEETDSLCPRLTTGNVHAAALPGGHPMRRDTDAVYHALTTALADTAA